ncbi:class I SAM-dependent methyltransferase [Pseudooceanicola sp. CBS1P-1]|uniref:Uncharacterized protein n=1 Tax=Pseudooceanicola albus TaxID=2692189 RepID=A0A6L7G9Q4_9RHOB|nr:MULTISPECIES: class I SAM-dependent methyltransferase [Pseudooceanicola]MBT9385798.1 class I SAM-dependent methyltransferase [Pseudooceanicola endophyticus]MXN20030.1 hypothetical protein [Pseudooceanicola albus]
MESEAIETRALAWRADQRVAWPMKRLGHAQLGATEGAMIYHLARDWVSGRRPVVELGSFLGASASLLGKGLMENPGWDGAAHLHCYDLFEAKFGNMAAFIRDRIDPSFRDGEDFLPLFRGQTEEVAPAITIHKGDFEAAKWRGGRIDLLFVDISKTPALNRVILERFFPGLEPGEGLMVNQDFHNPGNPWVQTSMGYLLDYFEVLEPRADDSVLMRLRRPIPTEVLVAAGRYETLSGAERLARVERLIAAWRGAGWDARYLELVQARLLIQAGAVSEGHALIEAARAAAGAPDPQGHFFWEQRCETVRGGLWAE